MRGRPNITQRPQRTKTLRGITTPAPTKGLNTVDPLSHMDPAFGLNIQNFIATPQGLSLRKGYRKWATGLPTSVTSLLPYHQGGSGSSKLFAVSGTAFYDVTTAGPVGAPIITGLTGSKPYWQSTMQTYTAGNTHYLITVNGADAPRIFDGTSWTTCTQVANPLTPGQFKTTDFNGNTVSINTMVDVMLHQQRLWFVRDNSTLAYYTDIGVVGGVLYPFDFGSLFPRGGKLLKLAAWTMDMGGTQGNQALLVAISDRGDVAIYIGNNPASATSWSLSGVYQLGAPVGRRCTTQLQGDLLILSQDGLYPLSNYLQSERVQSTAALTYTIMPTISDLVAGLASTPGFEMVVYPGANALMLNIPQSQQASNFQFCYHSITKAWTQFTGWPAQCFGMFNDGLYFGGTDFVGIGFAGFMDGADFQGNGGTAYAASFLTAFTNMDAPGVMKHVKMMKPYIVTGSSSPTIKVGINTDFNLTPISGTAATSTLNGAVWDIGRWDGQNAQWVGNLATYNQWATALGYAGEYIAFACSLTAQADTMIVGVGWMVEPGGVFG